MKPDLGLIQTGCCHGTSYKLLPRRTLRIFRNIATTSRQVLFFCYKSLQSATLFLLPSCLVECTEMRMLPLPWRLSNTVLPKAVAAVRLLSAATTILLSTAAVLRSPASAAFAASAAAASAAVLLLSAGCNLGATPSNLAVLPTLHPDISTSCKSTTWRSYCTHGLVQPSGRLLRCLSRNELSQLLVRSQSGVVCEFVRRHVD